VNDTRTFDLFAPSETRPGALGCRTEISALLADAMKRAADRGISREEIASRMSVLLGEKIGVATLNGYAAQSHADRDISLMRAMAFDAAVDEDALLGLFAEKRGGRSVVSNEDAALLEWAHLHRQEKELAERKKALEAVFKLRGERKRAGHPAWNVCRRRFVQNWTAV
jgi:transcriptional regulator with XRE-family HTH domain